MAPIATSSITPNIIIISSVAVAEACRCSSAVSRKPSKASPANSVTRRSATPSKFLGSVRNAKNRRARPELAPGGRRFLAAGMLMNGVMIIAGALLLANTAQAALTTDAIAAAADYSAALDGSWLLIIED